jgi:hypothetical protein
MAMCTSPSFPQVRIRTPGDWAHGAIEFSSKPGPIRTYSMGRAPWRWSSPSACQNHLFPAHYKLAAADTQSQTLTGLAAGGFLAHARRTVPSPTPNWRAIARHETPEARREAIRVAFTTTRGRPSLLPFERALRRPARTLSRIKSRSRVATAATMVNTA